MIRYKLLVLLFVISISFGVESFGREYKVASPDKNLRLKVNVEQKILYSLGYKSKQLLKPGKVAWDWWNANNLYGVDFRAGLR